MTGSRFKNHGIRTVAAVAALLALATLWAPPSGAQDDPYGSTTTTSTPPGQVPSCQLRTRQAQPGEVASVTVRQVPRGDTVRLLFDGSEVASAQATGPGNSARVNVDMSFTVPEDASEGAHQLTAVGTGFAVDCRTSNGRGFVVLAANQSRGLPRSTDILGLPRTGVYVALLLAVAAALLLLGRGLLAESRRRSREQARAGRHAERDRVSSHRE